MKLNCLSRCLFCIVMAFPLLASGFEARVKSVGPDSLTILSGTSKGLKVTNIATSGKTTRASDQNVDAYSVKPTTVISVDGLPSKLSDVKAGMKVLLTQGSDSSVASSISANTVPPAAPRADPKVKKPKKLNRGIGSDRVLLMTPERITFGQAGADKARAYFIIPSTVIMVNGKKATAEAVKEGMDVHVNAKDGTTAGMIVAKDASD